MKTTSTLRRDDALRRLEELLTPIIPDGSRAWWNDHRSALAEGRVDRLPVAFPGLTRRLGRDPLVEPTDDARFLTCESFRLDLAGFRRADVGAALLLEAARGGGLEAGVLRDLFDHGDLDERVGVMRSLPVLAWDDSWYEFFGEAQRSNTKDVYEAAWCDHDLASRHLDDDDFNRMVLKLAFSDIPVWRVLGATQRANPTLSHMLQDFAVEREAAGRPMWPDTLTLIARAPVEGTSARLVGHLEHGKDELRRLAARNLQNLGAYVKDGSLVRHLQERLPRERHSAVRKALEEALRKLG